MIWTYSFWMDTAERMVRGAGIGALVRITALVGPDVVNGGGFDALHTDWLSVLGYALGGTVLSLLFSLVASKTAGTPGTASFVRAATAPPAVGVAGGADPVLPGQDHGQVSIAAVFGLIVVVVLVFLLLALAGVI